MQNAQAVVTVSEKRSKLLFEEAKRLAHDIRSPLSALNLIARKVTAADPEALALLHSCVDRIDEIARRFLHLDPESTTGEFEASQEIMELTDFRRMVETLIAEKTIERNFPTIELIFPVEFKALIRVAPSEMVRILSSLINNSIDASARAIQIKVESGTKTLRVEVCDDGQGIPQHHLRLIGRAGVSIGKGKEGHGLGLFQACRLISAWGGRFSIIPRPEGGTLARIELPMP